MKVKTVEATGKKLDWGIAVVICNQNNCNPTHQDGQVWIPVTGIVFGTTNIDIGGNNHVPLNYMHPVLYVKFIKQHKISVRYSTIDCFWSAAQSAEGAKKHLGETPEQAVARCVISMRLGDEFECPDELEGV